MYESFYNLTAKPFQLRPDPNFFFGSKGHRRAMAYLQYGLSQEEGFIVITGEIGAGKTTLVRNLFRQIKTQNIVASQVVNTHLEGDEILRMVAAAFNVPYQDATKATLLGRLEQFFRACDQQGKRVLLVVDEAQNLPARALEELRMLSNFQTDERALLQTFLLGQPEFRKTLHSDGMQQLNQRVIATYHLGPLDADDTRAYIEHRLRTVDWTGCPSINEGAFAAIVSHTGGIPRKINALCDRLFLHGSLEEIFALREKDVLDVISDIRQEAGFDSNMTAIPGTMNMPPEAAGVTAIPGIERIHERLGRMENSFESLLDAVKKKQNRSK